VKLNPAELPPGTEVGHWRLLEKLGVGGYGAVYLACDVRPVEQGGWPSHVAVKVALLPGEVAMRSDREAELLSRVNHPNVVGFIEAGRWPDTPTGLPFLVMRYVPGLNLYRWVDLHNLRVREMLEIFHASALAVDAVHEVRALHRDVKGENILIREEDGQPVLVDLGVGDYEGATTITDTQLPPGTLPYRSPEALRFQKDNLGNLWAHYEFQRTDDLYALGVTWYRALTSEYPYTVDGRGESLRARVEGQQPQAASALNPRVPEEVSRLVQRVLSPRPKERPARGRELADAVRVLLEGRAHGLEAYLFEWDEERSLSSRTTERTDPLEERRRRLLRRRTSQPGSPAVALVEEPRQVQVSRAALALLLGLAAFVSAGVSLVVAELRAVQSTMTSTPVTQDSRVRSEPLSSTPTLTSGPEKAETPGGTASSVPMSAPKPTASRSHPKMKELPPVNTRKPAQRSSPTPEMDLVPADDGFMKKCLAAAGATVLACASAQVTPSEGDRCPRDTLAVMKALEMEVGEQGWVTVDINQPGGNNDDGFYRDGSIVSQVGLGVGALPEGSLLYGQMYTGGERIKAYYTRARFPDDREFPVCIALGYLDNGGGVPKAKGSKPGSAINGRALAFTVVERFE
jgi:serine/threonine-protein kinase